MSGAQLEALAQAFLADPGPRTSAALQDHLTDLDTGFLQLDARLAEPPLPHGWRSHGIVKREVVELSLFLLPAGRQIPIHDHPGLHGWMHLLRGRLRIQAWDWTDPEAGLALPVQDDELAAGQPIPPIGPAERNLHRVQALEDSAFLDLFVPPYPPGGCSYYAHGGPGPNGTVRLVRSSGLI